jgi:hypothetical protein
MIYRLAADAVLVLHLAFILFVVLGGFLVQRRPWLGWPHLPVAAWGAWIEFSGWICPLTPLENFLRELGGGSAYSGGFIEHYLTSLIYPDGLSRNIQWAIGAAVVAINLMLYMALWRRRRARG